MTTDSADSIAEAADPLDAVIESLDGPKGVLRVEAIRAAREHRERITPRLIKLIQEATDATREDVAPESNGHFFALFLLIEFRATEALPVILDAVSLPGESPFELFGDAIHEAVPHVVPAMAKDRLDDILSLIRNRELNEYVRWSLASGISMLVTADVRPREEIVELLRELLREAVGNGDFELITPLVHTLHDLYPEEAYPDIEDAYRRGLVEEMMIAMDDIDAQLSRGKEESLRQFGRRSPYIEDTIAELQHWAAFRERDKPKPAVTEPAFPQEPNIPSADPSPSSRFPADPEDYAPPEPVRNENPRVRRNDPCPCGSGKKFKKCCGSAKRGGSQSRSARF
jgi:hypothetical protein